MRNIRLLRLPIAFPVPARIGHGGLPVPHARAWKTIRSTLAVAAFVLLPRLAWSEVLFQDGFESGFSAQWVVGHHAAQPRIGEWGTNSNQHWGGNWSAFCADNGDDQRATYDTLMLTWMQLYDVSLEGFSDASLEFRLWMNTEANFDFFSVFLQDQDSVWYALLRQSGRDDSWRLVTLNLGQFTGHTGLLISFEFYSDSTIVPGGQAGVWIDDVVLRATPAIRQADMQLANLIVGPSTIRSGQEFQTCTYEITNQGPTTLTDEPFAIAFYLSANQTFGDGDDVRIGGIQARGSFATGVATHWALSPQERTGMVRDWPVNQPEGNYHIAAVLKTSNELINDPDSVNNRTLTAATVFVNVPLEANYTGAPIDTARSSGVNALTVSYNSAAQGVTGTCYLRQGGASSFSAFSMVSDGNGTLRHTLGPGDLGLRGLEYYFEIASIDESVRIPAQAGFFVMRTELSDVTVATTVDRQYKMIGFPFEPKPTSVELVFDEITDLSATGWRFGHWDPESETYSAYPSLTTVNRGLGYWLITSGNRTIRAAGVSSIPDDVFGANRYGQITLEPGWNQISSPFAFNVAAAAVVLGGSVEGKFYEYTGSGYQIATSLRPFAGYWVRNNGGRSYIRVPYAEAGAAASAENSSPGTDGWQLRFKVRSGSREDRLNVVGTHPAASESFDGFDYHEPPGFAEYVSMSFLQADVSGGVDRLSSDFRPAGRPGYTFDVLLTGTTDAPVQFAAVTESDLPPGYRVILVDPQTSEAYDVLDRPTITLPHVATESGTRYKLLIGSEEYLAGSGGQTGAIPRRFTLLQNYPNPFNAGTVITYELPEISDVRLEVYDVLGRRVVTLVQDHQDSGRHQISWDGRDAAGQSLASGVYVYRLQAADNVLTRKMVLLK